MSFRSRMKMRCTIQRSTAGTGAWGLPGAPGWADLATVACYAWLDSGGRGGGGESVRNDEVVVLSLLHVYMPLHTDIVETDQIVSVTDRQANVLFAGPLNVRVIARRPYLLGVMAVSAL